MVDTSQKLPVTKSLNLFAEQKISNANQLNGKAIPASVVSVNGAMITVKFEINSVFTLPYVTVPLFGPEYIRYPIQPGDKGVVFATDFHLGQMSGQSTTTADTSAPANIASLVFFPIGNTAWSSVDPDAVTIYGPNGVVLRDTGNNSSIVITPTGIVVTGKTDLKLVVGSSSIEVNETQVIITGDLVINGTRFLLHEHTGVTTGSSNTGGVV